MPLPAIPYSLFPIPYSLAVLLHSAAMSNANFQALPGFRDFYPDDFAVRAHIMRTWREVARRYGFQEYDGPPLEPLELYTEKSGP